MKKIETLEPGQKGIDTEGKIVEMSPVKTFTRMGSPGRVVVAVLKDDTGKINLTLWDDEVEEYEKGDEIVVKNCSITEFRGVKQIKTGRKGTIEKN